VDPSLVTEDRWLLRHVPSNRIFCPLVPERDSHVLFVFRSESDAEEYVSLMNAAPGDFEIHRVTPEFLQDFARALRAADPKVGFVSLEEFDEKYRVETRLRTKECN